MKHDDKTIIDPTERTRSLRLTLANLDPPKLNKKHKMIQNEITNKLKNIKIKHDVNEYNKSLSAKMHPCKIENCVHEVKSDKACNLDLIHDQTIAVR